jgi:8-oxo-dGTP diphosphatase
LEGSETPIEALKREMKEEVRIDINVETIKDLGTFYAEAAGKDGVRLRMDVFIINDYVGEPIPSSEIEEIRWVNTQTDDIEIGSIFKHDVMPLLKQMHLID